MDDRIDKLWKAIANNTHRPKLLPYWKGKVVDFRIALEIEPNSVSIANQLGYAREKVVLIEARLFNKRD